MTSFRTAQKKAALMAIGLLELRTAAHLAPEPVRPLKFRAAIAAEHAVFLVM